MGVYRLSLEARLDLREIFDYSLVHFGEVQAYRYAEHLESAMQLLAVNNEAGRPRPGIEVSLRSFPAESHVIYYEIEEDGVFILRVLGQRMNEPDHLTT